MFLAIPTIAWSSNSDQVWTNDLTCNGTCVLRSWSDLYFTVQNSVTFSNIVSSNNLGGNCQGCWSIQFNAGNDRSSNSQNKQTNYPVEYQFVIVVSGYSSVAGAVVMLVPTSWTSCPPSGWTFSTGSYKNYCTYTQSFTNTYNNLANSGRVFTLEPTVNSGGSVTSVYLCASTSYSACNIWSTTISIPYSSGGHIFQNPYNAGQVNIVGQSSLYPSGSFSYTGSYAGVMYVWSPDTYNFVYFAAMYWSTGETSNLSYSWGYCPCAGNDNATFQ